MKSSSSALGLAPAPRRAPWIFLALSLLPHAGAADMLATGNHQFGQSSAPLAASQASSVVAGWDFNLAIDAEGNIVGWGRAEGGRTSPPPDLGRVLSLSAGMTHTLAVLPDGQITGWGGNTDGVLDVPAHLPPALTVAAGAFHSLALLQDGTVAAWGFKGNQRTQPPADLRKVIAIAAGRDHSLALKADGTVVAWGLNDMGQSQVPVGLDQVVAIAAGASHSLALRRDGTVVAWGDREFNQASVPSDLRDVVAIAAGLQHSLALKKDGTISAWGSNANHQLDLPGAGFTAISAGATHSLALRGGPLLTLPPSRGLYFAGSEATLQAQSSDALASYQWLYNGEPISGATAPTLNIPALGRHQAGLYSVQIRNTKGTTTSPAATLAVRGRPLPSLERRPDGSVSLVVADEFDQPISPQSAPDYRLLTSPNLLEWTASPIAPRSDNGRLRFDDPSAAAASGRFYKIVQD